MKDRDDELSKSSKFWKKLSNISHFEESSKDRKEDIDYYKDRY